jgi:hypothetical protein
LPDRDAGASHLGAVTAPAAIGPLIAQRGPLERFNLEAIEWPSCFFEAQAHSSLSAFGSTEKMATISKAPAAGQQVNIAALAAADRVAFTIPQFCYRNNISVWTYNNILRRNGRGPQEMRLGNKVLISIGAEADWEQARRNPVGAEAEEIARTIERQRAKGRQAAARSIQSPAHISNVRRERGRGRGTA